MQTNQKNSDYTQALKYFRMFDKQHFLIIWFLTQMLAERAIHQESYEVNKREKKRYYNENIMNIEQDTFKPVVMSVNGGCGKKCAQFYAGLAELIANVTNRY